MCAKKTLFHQLCEASEFRQLTLTPRQINLMESVLPTDSDIVILPVLKRDGDEGRVVRYHLKFAYHDTIVKVSRYTLGIDASNEHLIFDN